MSTNSVTYQMWSRIGFMSATRYSYQHRDHYLLIMFFVPKLVRDLANFLYWMIGLGMSFSTPFFVGLIGLLAWPILLDISLMTLGALFTPATLIAECVLPQNWILWLTGQALPIEPPAGCAPANLWQEICDDPEMIRSSYRRISQFAEVASDPACQEILNPYECPVSLDMMQDPVVVVSASQEPAQKYYQHTFDLNTIVDNVQHAVEQNKYRDPLNRQPIVGVFRNQKLRAELAELVKTLHDCSSTGPRLF